MHDAPPSSSRSSLRSSLLHVVAVLGGLVLTATGAALALPHLRVEGWGTVGVAGALLAVAGAVVLVGGAVGLVRGTRGWWRWLYLPAGLVLAYVVAFPVTMAVAATQVPRAKLGPDTPADRGLAYDDVTFRTTDGVTLSGWYVPARNRAAVVVAHGASSTRSGVLDQATVLARHGYGVLLFDARGMGRSGGRAMNLGWHGEADVAAAVTWLSHRPDIDPARVGALGESMGGEEAIGALGADTRLRAVVAEGATNRVAGDRAWLSDAHGVRGAFQEGVDQITYALTGLLTSAPEPVPLRRAVARAAPRPVLLITAGKVPDEADAGRYIRSGSLPTVELWSVPGASHTGGLRAQPREWERRVVAFFDRSLRPAA